MDRKPPRGRTFDPWPCCGDDPDEGYGRSKQDVICHDCQRLIAIGRETKKREAEGGAKRYIWTAEPYWWPSYYGPYTMDHDAHRRMQRAMFAVVQRVTLPLTDIDRERWYITSGEHNGFVLDCEGSHVRYRGTIPVSLKPAVRDRLNELDAAIRQALKSAYATGLRTGKSALAQMASGQLTLDDFDSAGERD